MGKDIEGLIVDIELALLAVEMNAESNMAVLVE